MPSVGPTGYVFPLSQTAETVKWVGVAMTDVIFQPKVTGSLGAILKNEVAVCGGLVMVRPPAGAVWGMAEKELEVEAVALGDNDPACGRGV